MAKKKENQNQVETPVTEKRESFYEMSHRLRKEQEEKNKNRTGRQKSISPSTVSTITPIIRIRCWMMKAWTR